MSASWRGAARPLGGKDVADAAAAIGCIATLLAAVLAVETLGHGFDAHGRPAMLFEPHRFYAELAAKPVLRVRAVTLGLAYPVWGTRPYPADSYPRLDAAVSLDRNAALRSASWGLGQVLGSNCGLAGCSSADEMVSAAMESEFQQLRQMVCFIRARGLATALVRGDWASFARGYNGTAYRRNAYDTKLAAAYARLAGRSSAPVIARVAPPAAVAKTVTGQPPPQAELTADDLNAQFLRQLGLVPE